MSSVLDGVCIRMGWVGLLGLALVACGGTAVPPKLFTGELTATPTPLVEQSLDEIERNLRQRREALGVTGPIPNEVRATFGLPLLLTPTPVFVQIFQNSYFAQSLPSPQPVPAIRLTPTPQPPLAPALSRWKSVGDCMATVRADMPEEYVVVMDNLNPFLARGKYLTVTKLRSLCQEDVRLQRLSDRLRGFLRLMDEKTQDRAIQDVLSGIGHLERELERR